VLAISQNAKNPLFRLYCTFARNRATAGNPENRCLVPFNSFTEPARERPAAIEALILVAEQGTIPYCQDRHMAQNFPAN
jgi:hypothetical protein